VQFASEGLAAVRRAGEALHEAVDRLDDSALREPSRLTGWTRGHVVTHLARNADGLVNLLHWARTGIESPMYASRADREADIEEGANRLARVQQEDLRAADERFAMATEVMAETDWAATVLNNQGRPVDACLVPWLRLTELLVHHVDLGVGFTFERAVRVAGDQVGPLLDCVADTWDGRSGVPGVRLAVRLPSGEERTWLLGAGTPVEVHAAPAPALAWLTGRGGPGDGLPPLPSWL
jgi:maleylpyruvate isomerase